LLCSKDSAASCADPEKYRKNDNSHAYPFLVSSINEIDKVPAHKINSAVLQHSTSLSGTGLESGVAAALKLDRATLAKTTSLCPEIYHPSRP
jgi:hypothetical protein